MKRKARIDSSVSTREASGFESDSGSEYGESWNDVSPSRKKARTTGSSNSATKTKTEGLSSSTTPMKRQYPDEPVLRKFILGW